LLRWPLGTALRGLFAAVAVSCHAHSPSLAKSSTHGGSLTRNYIQLLLFKCVWASFAKLLCPTGALGTKTRFIFIRTAIVVWWYVSGGCWLGSTPHLLTCYEMLLASFNCTHVLRVLRSTRDEKKTEKKQGKRLRLVCAARQWAQQSLLTRRVRAARQGARGPRHGVAVLDPTELLRRPSSTGSVGKHGQRQTPKLCVSCHVEHRDTDNR
jgi:hypothetical protein